MEVEKIAVKPLWHPIIDFEKLMDKVYGGTGDGMGYRNDTKHMFYGEALKLKFSCPFDFDNFPFDSNHCCLSYKDDRNGASDVTLRPAIITYDNMTTTEGPVILNSLPFPYRINITSKSTLDKVDKGDEINYSKTGLCLNTFSFQTFVNNAQQCFAFTPQANFPIQNLNFH